MSQHEYEDSIKMVETAMATLDRTVQANCENIKKIQFQIWDVEKSSKAFQQVLRTYLRETRNEASKKVVISRPVHHPQGSPQEPSASG